MKYLKIMDIKIYMFTSLKSLHLFLSYLMVVSKAILSASSILS